MAVTNNIDNRVLEALEKGLSNHKGKQNAITSAKIVEAMKPTHPTITGSDIRRHINYLRTVEKIFICADSSGYYLPAHEIEAKHQLASIQSRIKELRLVDIAQREACQKLFGQSAMLFDLD